MGRARNRCLAAISSLALAYATANAAIASDLTISQSVNGSTLTISASQGQYAGAIDSLVFRGTQYVDANDHGRLLQSAAVFDPGLGCLNPTEAGSMTDSSGSSSSLLSISNSNNVLSTNTNGAWYIQPVGGKAANGTTCNDAGYPKNPSGTIFQKTVSFGYAGISNLIGYTSSITPGNATNHMSWEAATAYSPPSFSVFLNYNPASRNLGLLTANSTTVQQSAYPVIVTTSDGKNAIAEVASSAPAYYGYYYYNGGSSSTAKQNCDYEFSSVSAGATYTEVCALAVGTVDEVIATLNAFPNQTADGDAPIYRFFKAPQHFYTASYTEGASAGFKLDGTDFHVYPSGGNGLVALYRCIRANANDHFASTSSTCEGYKVEGVFGYISPSNISGTVALYRFSSAANNDHLITTNYAEGANNSAYHLDGTLGYVPTS